MQGEVWAWDATETAAAIRAHKISSREATEAALTRLHQVNPAINAVVETLEEEALAAAENADSALRNKEPVGLLHGVPVSVKINVDLAGHATTNGLVPLKNAIAAEDSSSVAALRRAGAVIIGRTNVPAFSYRWFTSNDLHGATRNPWNPKLSVGGSSGGAAAATAASIGTLAHGNDVAGSLRLPASACGVYGMRPTVGRLAGHNPSQPFEKSLCLQTAVTEGVIARSVRDLKLGIRALEVPDHRDPVQLPFPMPHGDNENPCHVAIYTGEGDVSVSPEIVNLVRKSAAWLEEAGYVVEEVRPPRLQEMGRLWMGLLYAECSGATREILFQLGDEAFRQSFTDTAANVPAFDFAGFLAAWQQRHAILREWKALFQRYPLLLMPVSFQPTFPADHDLSGTDAVREIVEAFSPLSATSGLALPGISVPAGLANGAPAGVQIVADHFGDDRCLAAAGVLERKIGTLGTINWQEA